MTKSQAIQWKTACWIAVGGFTAASAWFGWSMHQLYIQFQSTHAHLMCGNSITDPLGVVLGAAPFSLAGVAGFIFLLHRKSGSWLAVAISAVLTLGCTTGLLIFGFRFVQGLPGIHLSDFIWWLPSGV